MRSIGPHMENTGGLASTAGRQPAPRPRMLLRPSCAHCVLLDSSGYVTGVRLGLLQAELLSLGSACQLHAYPAISCLPSLVNTLPTTPATFRGLWTYFGQLCKSLLTSSMQGQSLSCEKQASKRQPTMLRQTFAGLTTPSSTPAAGAGPRLASILHCGAACSPLAGAY